MKYPSLILFSIIVLTSCGGDQPADLARALENEASETLKTEVIPAAEGVDYNQLDALLADITAQMHQPNILKDDILRGWYLGSRSDRKYGTPNTWIFIEDGANSKWISPNVLEEEDLIDERQLCKQTAGSYLASCLETSDSDCEYINDSYCHCLSGTRWKEEQGCILVTEKGSFVSINNLELAQGWYLGFPNQKKLNTPPDWVWVEKGRESAWQKSN